MSEPAYVSSYEILAFTRDDDGVLVLRFHSEGGPVIFTERTHEELPAALEQISLDRDNTALIITGTGDAQTAPQWGVVSEVVPHERALERGVEIARTSRRSRRSTGACKGGRLT